VTGVNLLAPVTIKDEIDSRADSTLSLGRKDEMEVPDDSDTDNEMKDLIKFKIAKRMDERQVRNVELDTHKQNIKKSTDLIKKALTNKLLKQTEIKLKKVQEQSNFLGVASKKSPI
jgi:hypothetical protein